MWGIFQAVLVKGFRMLSSGLFFLPAALNIYIIKKKRGWKRQRGGWNLGATLCRTRVYGVNPNKKMCNREPNGTLVPKKDLIAIANPGNTSRD